MWVYNFGDGTVAEVDPVTDEVEHTTEISTVPTVVGLAHGPLLAADAESAWVIGYDPDRERYVLTRVLSGGRGKREHSLDAEFSAVAVADGAVWGLARHGTGAVVMRIDPRSGRVTGRTRLNPTWHPTRSAVKGAFSADLRRARTSLGAEGQGLALGGGFIW